MFQTQELLSRAANGMSTQPPPVHAPNSINSSNVAPTERAVSAATGTLLLMSGLRHGQVVRTLLGGGLVYRAISGSCPLYSALGLSTAASDSASDLEGRRSMPIGKSADELYRLWMDPQSLRQALAPLADVSLFDDGEMQWSVRTANGHQIELSGRVIDSRPGEFVRWESDLGAEVSANGFIRFRPAPADWGTEVTLGLEAASHGASALWSLQGLHSQVAAEKVLRRFKSLAETGEVPTLVRQPAARDGGRDQYP